MSLILFIRTTCVAVWRTCELPPARFYSLLPYHRFVQWKGEVPMGVWTDHRDSSALSSHSVFWWMDSHVSWIYYYTVSFECPRPMVLRKWWQPFITTFRLERSGCHQGISQPLYEHIGRDTRSRNNLSSCVSPKVGWLHQLRSNGFLSSLPSESHMLSCEFADEYCCPSLCLPRI